jgi:hypothetical protein
MMKSVARWVRLAWVAGALSLGVASTVIAERAYGDAGDDVVTTTPLPDQPQGLIPRRLVWPGVAVIIVIAVIVTAALTGPIIRANMDDEDDSSSPKSSE